MYVYCTCRNLCQIVPPPQYLWQIHKEEDQAAIGARNV